MAALGDKTRWWLAAMVAGTVVGIVMLLVQLSRGPEPSELSMASSPVAGLEEREPASAGHSAPQTSKGRGRVVERERADAVRAQLRASLGAAAKAEGRPPAEGERAARSRGANVDADEGELSDRVGLPPTMLGALRDEFMPLAGECIDAARERDPELEGMLGLRFTVASDPELGAVVDEVSRSVDRSTDTGDEELHRCLRETALSMLLPEPEAGGRFELLVTLPVGGSEP